MLKGCCFACYFNDWVTRDSYKVYHMPADLNTLTLIHLNCA